MYDRLYNEHVRQCYENLRNETTTYDQGQLDHEDKSYTLLTLVLYAAPIPTTLYSTEGAIQNQPLSQSDCNLSNDIDIDDFDFDFGFETSDMEVDMECNDYPTIDSDDSSQSTCQFSTENDEGSPTDDYQQTHVFSSINGDNPAGNTYIVNDSEPISQLNVVERKSIELIVMLEQHNVTRGAQREIVKFINGWIMHDSFGIQLICVLRTVHHAYSHSIQHEYHC